MKRLGSTYKVVGFFNPLGICYPAQVVPVYRLHNDKSERRKLYLQMRDESGVVEDFQEVPDTSQSIVRISGGKLNSVDQPAIYGFAFSDEEVHLFKGLPDYREFLTDALRGPRRRLISSRPIAGVEMARQIENERLEAVFASMATVKLSRAGGGVARGWLKNAPLSKMARERGYRSLARLERTDRIEAERIEFISTIVVSDHIHIQGDLIRVFDDGQIEVKVGGSHYRGWPTWNAKRCPLNSISGLGAFRNRGNFSADDIISIFKTMNIISDISERMLRALIEEYEISGGIKLGR